MACVQMRASKAQLQSARDTTAVCFRPATICGRGALQPKVAAPCPVVAPVSKLERNVAAFAKAAAKGFGAPKKAAPGSQKELEGSAPCPCGSGATYEACCMPYHTGAATAPTPEALLRSRFAAYVLRNPDYIADTTSTSSPEYTGNRSSYLKAVKQTQKRMDCENLRVQKVEEGSTPDETFITFAFGWTDREDKAAGVQERVEKSQFIRASASKPWLFRDSEFVVEPTAKEPPKKTFLENLGLGNSFIR